MVLVSTLGSGGTKLRMGWLCSLDSKTPEKLDKTKLQGILVLWGQISQSRNVNLEGSGPHVFLELSIIFGQSL
jgi:hypothetical protein